MANQRREHPLYLGDFVVQLFVFSIGQKTKISSQQKMVFQFAGRSRRDIQESLEFGIPALTTTFRYVCGNRYRTPPNLTG
jgi:hypothetical protein